MPRTSSSWPAFLALLAVAAAFVLLSGRSLPAVVAAHFAAGGNADGFMPRGPYLGAMLALVVGVPLLLAVVHGTVLRFVLPHRINLPNRDYWLAPERVAETFDFLRAQGIRFAALLTAFLCFVHWLVVQANAVQPPHFPEGWFVLGLAGFLGAIALWFAAFVQRFRKGQ